jgi:hypothetical protein
MCSINAGMGCFLTSTELCHSPKVRLAYRAISDDELSKHGAAAWGRVVLVSSLQRRRASRLVWPVPKARKCHRGGCSYTGSRKRNHASEGEDDDGNESDQFVERLKRNELTYEYQKHPQSLKVKLVNLRVSKCYKCNRFADCRAAHDGFPSRGISAGFSPSDWIAAMFSIVVKW